MRLLRHTCIKLTGCGNLLQAEPTSRAPGKPRCCTSLQCRLPLVIDKMECKQWQRSWRQRERYRVEIGCGGSLIELKLFEQTVIVFLGKKKTSFADSNYPLDGISNKGDKGHRLPREKFLFLNLFKENWLRKKKKKKRQSLYFLFLNSLIEKVGR